MNSDAFRPQVIDPENTANDVPPKVVKHEDLPYGLPIFTQQGCGVGIVRCVDTWNGGRCFFVIQTQYPLNSA